MTIAFSFFVRRQREEVRPQHGGLRPPAAAVVTEPLPVRSPLPLTQRRALSAFRPACSSGGEIRTIIALESTAFQQRISRSGGPGAVFERPRSTFIPHPQRTQEPPHAVGEYVKIK